MVNKLIIHFLKQFFFIVSIQRILGWISMFEKEKLRSLSMTNFVTGSPDPDRNKENRMK